MFDCPGEPSEPEPAEEHSFAASVPGEQGAREDSAAYCRFRIVFSAVLPALSALMQLLDGRRGETHRFDDALAHRVSAPDSAKRFALRDGALHPPSENSAPVLLFPVRCRTGERVVVRHSETEEGEQDPESETCRSPMRKREGRVEMQ